MNQMRCVKIDILYCCYVHNVLTINEMKHIIKLRMEGDIMATTNLNIRTDKDIKEQAEIIFAELGLNMTTAINMFLRTTIRENGIPFSLKLEIPNNITIAAIEEGRRIAYDTSVKGYSNMEELRKALEV